MSRRVKAPRRVVSDSDAFVAYFDTADEIYEPQGFGEHKVRLTLDDLDTRMVRDARVAAERFGLPWPPYLPVRPRRWGSGFVYCWVR